MSTELELLAQKYKLLSYHVPYLTQFLSVYDVKGKDVLEVGGAMPREIVIDHLGANSWTCTESPQYDEELGEANQQTLSGATSAGGNYHTLLKNVEDFDLEQEGRFDCIFSIACFEHIAKFPQALDTMYRCLKPGGVMVPIKPFALPLVVYCIVTRRWRAAAGCAAWMYSSIAAFSHLPSPRPRQSGRTPVKRWWTRCRAAPCRAPG